MVDVENYYRRYGPMVLRRCRALLRDEEDAVDAMQDVFVQVLKRQDLLADTAPSSLLYRIATNISLNKIRSSSRRPEDADHGTVIRIAQAAGNSESQVNARGILARLFSQGEDARLAQRGINTQTLATMHLVDGYTLEEVATQTGMSVSGVRKRLRNLKAKLRTLEPSEVLK